MEYEYLVHNKPYRRIEAFDATDCAFQVSSMDSTTEWNCFLIQQHVTHVFYLLFFRRWLHTGLCKSKIASTPGRCHLKYQLDADAMKKKDVFSVYRPPKKRYVSQKQRWKVSLHPSDSINPWGGWGLLRFAVSTVGPPFSEAPEDTSQTSWDAKKKTYCDEISNAKKGTG